MRRIASRHIFPLAQALLRPWLHSCHSSTVVSVETLFAILPLLAVATLMPGKIDVALRQHRHVSHSQAWLCAGGDVTRPPSV